MSRERETHSHVFCDDFCNVLCVNVECHMFSYRCLPMLSKLLFLVPFLLLLGELFEMLNIMKRHYWLMICSVKTDVCVHSFVVLGSVWTVGSVLFCLSPHIHKHSNQRWTNSCWREPSGCVLHLYKRALTVTWLSRETCNLLSADK